MAMTNILRFTRDELDQAYESWGCNCGPSALAAAIGCTLDRARQLLPEFEAKRYTSPRMMMDALNESGVKWREITKSRKVLPGLAPEVLPENGLVRVQWTGPWTASGANQKWAYKYTHWFATMDEVLPGWLRRIFDVNVGPTHYAQWCGLVPSLITKQIPRADGGFYFTHLWEVMELDGEGNRAQDHRGGQSIGAVGQ